MSAGDGFKSIVQSVYTFRDTLAGFEEASQESLEKLLREHGPQYPDSDYSIR